MAQGLGEARTHLARSFEELMGEVLCKEGEHEVGALRVRYELPPEQEAMAQELGIWQLLLPWLGRWEGAVAASCLSRPDSGPSGLTGPNRSTQEAQNSLPSYQMAPCTFSTKRPQKYLRVTWHDIWNVL